MADDANEHLKHFMLDDHAQAIGYACIYWSNLEARLDGFFAWLAALQVGEISESVTANADIRNKIKMIIALAFLRKPNVDWFERVKKLMDNIDNDLRTERNRYVHDSWVIEAAKTMRRTKETKIKRPQAFKLELTIKEDIEIKPGQIWTLVAEIDSAISAIMRLQIEGMTAPRDKPVEIHISTSLKK